MLRDQHQYLLQHCIERLRVSWCHYYALDSLSKTVTNMFNLQTCLMSELTRQCAQHCFADSSEVCSGIVILGLVLSLVFAHKGRTTDLNTSSMYTWLIKCPSITTRSVDLGLKFSISRETWRTLMHENLCLLRKSNFAKNGVKTSQPWHRFTKLLWALQTQRERHYKEKWWHYTIVKIKSL